MKKKWRETLNYDFWSGNVYLSAFPWQLSEYTPFQIDFKYLGQNTFLNCVSKDFNSIVEHYL